MTPALHLGDCFDVMPTLQAGSVDMVLADLPYGTTNCAWDSPLSLRQLWIEYSRLCHGPIVLFAQTPRTVLTFASDKQRSKLHPTQKPVALCEYLIRTYTNPGATVLDNCMGSGTTGVACVNTGRQFVGIENDPAHFAAAQTRLGAFDARAA